MGGGRETGEEVDPDFQGLRGNKWAKTKGNKWAKTKGDRGVHSEEQKFRLSKHSSNQYVLDHT